MSVHPDSIVYEGWLTKSPPPNRIWRAKWSRRWFTLKTKSPGHYYLDYYTDKSNRKLKGTIDLNSCDQVDSGLQMQRRSSEGSSFRGSVFSIKTLSRVYHLAADSVTEMEKWVEVICHVCGMTSFENDKYFTKGEASLNGKSSPNPSGPYIPISECITGMSSHVVEERKSKSLVFFNPRFSKDSFRTGITSGGSVRASSRLNSLTEEGRLGISKSPNLANCENDLVFEDKQNSDTSNAGQMRDCETKFALLNMMSPPEPPMRPRPPKPSHLTLDFPQNSQFNGPRINEPNEAGAGQNKTSHGALTEGVEPSIRYNIYSNVAPGEFRSNGKPFQKSIHPPEVDRTKKPGRPRASSTKSLNHQDLRKNQCYRTRQKKLQYLDLDLEIPSSNPKNSHLKFETPTVYKTVDFLKTQALNMTRIDSESLRQKELPLHV